MYLMIENKDIIIISNQMLDDHYWTSKQYITMELIKKNRVLYVEANYSFGKLIFGIIGGKWPTVPFGRLNIENDNLSILTPFPRLPYRNHFRWIGWLNQKLLLKQIKKVMRRLNIDRPILWTFLHQTADLIGKRDESITIYHCVDDWPERFVMENMGRRSIIMDDEKALLESCDLIISVSPKLLDDYKIDKRKYRFIENGVDLNLFCINDISYQVPKDLHQIQKPVIGFIGSIGNWIDFKLYEDLLRSFPDFSFVMIGLNLRKKDIDLINQHKNFYYLGLKKQNKVPDYINYFDICLIPFNQTRIARGLLPQKMFQYLAMGKPVVSTDLFTLRPFNKILYLANNTDQFVTSIKHALEEIDNKKMERIEFTKRYSWPNRLNEYDNAIKGILN